VLLASTGVGCGGGGWASPQKNHFCPQNDKIGCILPFLTGRKHGSLGTHILLFNRKITKLTKTVQKLSKNSQSDQGGLHYEQQQSIAAV